MNDMFYFRLVIATVFAGVLLAVFDPSNRATSVAANTADVPTAAVSASPTTVTPASSPSLASAS
ncbi:MAG: hypothetical protein QM790_15565 [Nibricoccus sp.]